MWGTKRLQKLRHRLRGHGVCLHHALIGVGDHTGRCLEYGAAVPTPFTLRSC